MAAQSELGQGKNFVAQTPDGRVAELRVVKVHQDQDESLEAISRNRGEYRGLFKVSSMLSLVEAGIIIEGVALGNHHTSELEFAIVFVGMIGSAGTILYFNERIKDCAEKIDQIKKNHLPTINS